MPTHHQAQQHEPELVYIRLLGRVSVHKELRRIVDGTSDKRARVVASVNIPLRNPEVAELEGPTWEPDNVFQCDVAVGDTLGVDLSEGGQNLCSDSADVRTRPSVSLRQQRVKASSAKLHNYDQVALGGGELIKCLYDVRMIPA